MVGCFPFNAACSPLVFDMTKLDVLMVGCFPNNADVRPFTLIMANPPSRMKSCFPFNAVCSPLVFAMVKLPSVIKGWTLLAVILVAVIFTHDRFVKETLLPHIFSLEYRLDTFILGKVEITSDVS